MDIVNRKNEIRNYLSNMLNLQDDLNNKINSNWKKDLTLFDYYIAFKQELSELVDCYNWKWWKKMDDDSFNKKIEYVDMLHFILSQGLILMEIYNNRYKNFIDREFIIDDITFSTYLYLYKYANSNEINLTELTYKDILKLFFDLDKELYEFIINTENKDIINHIYIEWSVKYTFPNIFAKFLHLNNLFFNDIKEVYNLYLYKNALNILRQDEGYKSGAYKKVINGKEDNQYYYEIIKDKNYNDINDLITDLKNILVESD